MDGVGRGLHLTRSRGAGQLAERVEQAVDGRLRAGVGLTAHRAQNAVRGVHEVVGGRECLLGRGDKARGLVDGRGRGLGEAVERLAQRRNIGEHLVHAVERAVCKLGQLLALSGEVLRQTLVLVEYVRDVFEILEQGVRRLEQAGHFLCDTFELLGHGLHVGRDSRRTALDAGHECGERLSVVVGGSLRLRSGGACSRRNVRRSIFYGFFSCLTGCFLVETVVLGRFICLVIYLLGSGFGCS